MRIGRRLSQEELAHRAGISTRHLSCLETGRARPSHRMLQVLGAAMNLPLRVRNALFVASGFAPVYERLPLDDPAMSRVREAIARTLALYEPHPAMLLDRLHNVLELNDGAARLLAWSGVRFPPGAVANAVRALFDASYGLRECIVGFDGLADEVLARLRSEADVDPTLRAFVEEMQRLRGPASQPPDREALNPVALPIHLRRGGTNLRYFTTITTLGTPLDVTAQELRIEGWFPIDDETQAFGHRMAALRDAGCRDRDT